MRKLIFLCSVLFCIQTAQSQTLKSGEKITTDIVFTDINGTNHSVLKYCRIGKNVILNFFRVDSLTSWTYHNSRALQNVYNKYGWNNYMFMLDIGKATLPQLNGAASSGSLGNWIKGSPYPIVSLSDLERIAYESAFYNGNPPFNVDTTMICLVCADSSAHQIPYTMDSAALRQHIIAKCKFFEDPVSYLEAENIKSNVNTKDLNDSTINFVNEIANNKVIIVSFFNGSSKENWDYNTLGYLQQYYLAYEKYGPKDSRVFMFDVNEFTSKDDVIGFRNGPGNWMRTNDFSVSNLDSFKKDIVPVVSAFIKDGVLDTSVKIRTPLNFVVCNDNKVYRFDTTYNRQEIRDLVTTNCYKWAVGINDPITNSDILIGDDNLIHLVTHGQSLKDFNFIIYNSSGREIYRTIKTDPINMSELGMTNGLYFLNLNINGKVSYKKLMILN